MQARNQYSASLCEFSERLRETADGLFSQVTDRTTPAQFTAAQQTLLSENKNLRQNCVPGAGSITLLPQAACTGVSHRSMRMQKPSFACFPTSSNRQRHQHHAAGHPVALMRSSMILRVWLMP